MSKFSKEHGREPSAEERAGIEKTVDEKLAASDGEALVVEKVVAHFTAHHGRAPSAAEEADAGVVAAAPPSKEDNTPRGKAPEPVAQVSVEPAAKKQRVAEA